MSYISYQILCLNKVADTNTTKMKLLALVSSKIVFAALSFDLNMCLVKFDGENNYHIVCGYCTADISVDDTYSGEEMLVRADDGTKESMSSVCQTVHPETELKAKMYLCVDENCVDGHRIIISE